MTNAWPNFEFLTLMLFICRYGMLTLKFSASTANHTVRT